MRHPEADAHRAFLIAAGLFSRPLAELDAAELLVIEYAVEIDGLRFGPFSDNLPAFLANAEHEIERGLYALEVWANAGGAE